MDFLLNPFVTVLALLYQLLGNDIVLAIAAFTVIIRLATSPLLLQQQKSTEAAQMLQPQIKKLQEKYKNDREKLAAAQMELYKEYGVNPLGGCLPLLIQMPILFALYGAILYGLGSTPFQVVDMSRRFLIPSLDTLIPLNKTWLGLDLTQPPVFGGISTVSTIAAIALPLLVMITTWLQSKLTMPPMRPEDKDNPAAATTRTMTTIMPLMFGFFALSFSIGISIYFIVSNVVGIIQYTLLGKAHWNVLIPGLGSGVKALNGTAASPEKQRENDAILRRVTDRVDQMPKGANPALAARTSAAASKPSAAAKPDAPKPSGSKPSNPKKK
ncbi:MAG: YidC/Oxa1 family membrane protein insertase [Anaerolineae bacterium]|jgi:YidC/Oxa1 family membrane protein insertase|nr:YidC/Oxa1 family membrane protein insertase [Anaerolineae bacterium]